MLRQGQLSESLIKGICFYIICMFMKNNMIKKRNRWRGGFTGQEYIVKDTRKHEGWYFLTQIQKNKMNSEMLFRKNCFCV